MVRSLADRIEGEGSPTSRYQIVKAPTREMEVHPRLRRRPTRPQRRATTVQPPSHTRN
jgi:hypothetical protein